MSRPPYEVREPEIISLNCTDGTERETEILCRYCVEHEIVTDRIGQWIRDGEDRCVTSRTSARAAFFAREIARFPRETQIAEA